MQEVRARLLETLCRRALLSKPLAPILLYRLPLFALFGAAAQYLCHWATADAARAWKLRLIDGE